MFSSAEVPVDIQSSPLGRASPGDVGDGAERL